MKRFFLKIFGIALCCILFLLYPSCVSKREIIKKESAIYKHPKREFRGVWVQIAYQDYFAGKSGAEIKSLLTNMVKKFSDLGFNALIFQIRAEADAFYKSPYEPWSKALSGTRGVTPVGLTFDPLTLLIDECHKRGMEFHAWINPYRARISLSDFSGGNGLFNENNQKFIRYGNQLFFNPGFSENRKYLTSIVSDILMRYNVDAIHMDDYFYPYPKNNESFNDFQTYRQSSLSNILTKGDWRRNNVSLLVKSIKETISRIKPWVRFGISPFGIYRNKMSDPSGSDTRGLQNYDDLYADVLLWLKNGLIDYVVPQLYWNMGHPAADYDILIDWWRKNHFGQDLYIGQDIQRSLQGDQLSEKIEKSRILNGISGNCFWHGYLFLKNPGSLDSRFQKEIFPFQTLPPIHKQTHRTPSPRVKNLIEIFTSNLHYLKWESRQDTSDPEKAVYYVVYRFRKGEKIDIDNPRNIIAKTRNKYYILPYEGGKNKNKYAITAVNFFQEESKPSFISVIL